MRGGKAVQPDILEELYQNYYDAAYAYTLSLCKNREDTEAFLDSLQVVYRNLLLQKEGRISFLKDDEIADAIHQVEAARKQIRQGVAPSYAIRNLMLKIGG